jgi:integrase
MAKAKEAARAARISKQTVNEAEPCAGRFTVWDTDLKGFGLRVSPQGTKTYIARYRVGGGRRGLLRQMVIGRHGALTPEEARSRAKIVLGRAADGKDPQGDKASARAALTLSELCDLYLAEGVATKKASTLKLDKLRIERHIKPTIGRLRIGEVTRGDVERLIRDVASGKIRDEATPHTRGGKGAASRTAGLLGGIFTFAIDRKMLTENPTLGVKRFKDNKRERFLTAAELARLSDVMAEMVADDADRSRQVGLIVTKQHTQIIQLLLLTGARKNEIAELRWSEVDLAGGFLRLADSKTGAKIVMLGAGAAVVMATIKQGDSPWVFPDPKDPTRPVRNLDWAWVGIRKRANLDDVRIHDLRHTFASVALLGGHGLAFIGKLLGHQHSATTARYAHLADNPVKAAADRVSEAMAAAMAGKSAEVLDTSGRKVGA